MDDGTLAGPVDGDRETRGSQCHESQVMNPAGWPTQDEPTRDEGESRHADDPCERRRWLIDTYAELKGVDTDTATALFDEGAETPQHDPIDSEDEGAGTRCELSQGESSPRWHCRRRQRG